MIVLGVPMGIPSDQLRGLKAIPGSRDLLDLQAALTSGGQPSAMAMRHAPCCGPPGIVKNLERHFLSFTLF